MSERMPNPDDSIAEDSMETSTYTISDLAKEYDITPRTIRFYEDQGLLSLAEAKEIIELYDLESGGERQLTYFLEKIEHQRLNLKRQQEDIKAILHELKSVEKRVRSALNEVESK